MHPELLLVEHGCLSPVFQTDPVLEQQVTVLAHLMESGHAAHDLTLLDDTLDETHVILEVLCVMLRVEDVETTACLDLAIVCKETLLKFNPNVFMLLDDGRNGTVFEVQLNSNVIIFQE